jgi:hypothetical protein
VGARSQGDVWYMAGRAMCRTTRFRCSAKAQCNSTSASAKVAARLANGKKQPTTRYGPCHRVHRTRRRRKSSTLRGILPSHRLARSGRVPSTDLARY